jgi:hypothetical protein
MYSTLERQSRKAFMHAMHEAHHEMEQGVVLDASRARQLCHQVQLAAVWEIMDETETAIFKIGVLDYAGWLMQTFRGLTQTRVIDVTHDNHLAVLQGCELIKDMAMRTMQFTDHYLWMDDVFKLRDRGFIGLMSPYLGHSQETDNVITWLSDRIECIH